MNYDLVLLNYGVLGAWTAYLLYEKNKLFVKVVNALDRLSDVIEEQEDNKCQ